MNNMFQIRLHGRGGQGVVSAAEMLSVAAFLEGKHAQAFPSFGSERMGAPVMAFCRMDDKEIRLREPVMEPNALIIQDPTLLTQHAIFDGLPEDGFILLNSTRSYAELGIEEEVARLPEGHVCGIDASKLAMKYVGRPVPNAALLGGFAAVTRQLTLESVVEAIMKKFPGKIGEANVQAATDAYELVAA